MTITLDEFVEEERRRLDLFKAWWAEQYYAFDPAEARADLGKEPG
jgi:hypothetical protein